VIDALSRTVVAWYADECEDAKVTAKLVSRACLKERFSRRRKQLLILHADNGNALTVGLRSAIACFDAGGATGKLGVLRSFIRPRVSTVNPY